ncbi:chemotaxis protein CheA [Conexibacter sp. DBS9H8]|uniref:chemotaxis protein CheA n=1 Tax=Conexibacter sp. DBS9H8 TaxID=2937801 RepID=UPI0020106096|nr:chemotaxis protein CheA [Conexibacter sp. DBS9H8]
MDTSEYMPMFLAESREHLQDLNLAVVALENDPADRETVDQIFRIAHSLKGMSATMGFAQIAALTHEMEEVFELLRQRSGGLSQDAVDAVLACLDALSAAVDSIEEVGREDLDPALLIDRLARLVRTTAAGQVMHVLVSLDEATVMPAVRAHMVLAALGEHGAINSSLPGPDDLDTFKGLEIEAWVTTEQAPSELAAAITRVSDVAAVEVTEHTGELPGASPAPVTTGPAAAPAAEEAAQTPGPRPHAVYANHSAQTVRVDAERLDQLMHLMGELVIHRTAVEVHTQGLGSAALNSAMQNLTRSSQALQSMVMQVRMIPVDVVFMRFPRLVRDLSTKLNKEVELDLLGRDTELDRSVVDALGDPLVHLVRNSLDHGLEPPAEREAAGKPRLGRLTIAARHSGGSVVIEVRDDGRGINPQAVAAKAAAAGLIDPDAVASIDTRAAIELLFAPGFSTAETTSDISGRGVGMDAVRAKVRELGGEVLVESTRGAGTSAQIRLPLTLAIVSVLQVDIAGASFALPIDRVERALRLSEQNVRSVTGRRVLALADGIIPLLDGAATFGQTPTGTEDLVVIVRGATGRVGLTVDALVGQRELVTRPLPPVATEGQPVSGGAVLADGQIALIVDCDALIPNLGSGAAAPPAPPAPSRTNG